MKLEMIAKILAIKICSGEEGAFATNLKEGRVRELTSDDSVIPRLPYNPDALTRVSIYSTNPHLSSLGNETICIG